jgi:hypothetical protein
MSAEPAGAAVAPTQAAVPAPAAVAAAPALAASTPAVAPVTAMRCDNCGAPLGGRYCSACGQRREPPLHSLWHFLQVAAEDLTHADSRLWRTLAALLFKPGFLTAEFIAGRRARYLPPVRLYLVLSVVFFLWASATQTHPHALTITPQEHGPPTASVKPLAGESTSVFSPALPGESREQRSERICGKLFTYEGPWQEQVVRAWRGSCPRMVEDNGRSLQEAYMHNVPRAMFVFLPLLAAVMRLMYWRPRHYYVEHLLLFVHNHAFVFLVVLLAWSVSAPLPRGGMWLRAAVVLYIPWYVYRSMRVVYRQGRVLTLAKLAVLSFCYLVSGALMLALTVVYSALTL